MASIAVRYPEFKQLNTEILSISVDSVWSHKVWNEVELSKMLAGGIPYPMLADRSGDIGKLYGVYDFRTGKNIRGTFIIDPDGYIHAAQLLTAAVGRSTTEILRLLIAYQHNLATKEAVPCDWLQGKPTIKSSIEKAGQVWQEWKPDPQKGN